VAVPRVLVVVLAGGQGGRLELLTRSRAKPAVPYAGTYHLVDVVLTNVLRSGLSDVWLVEQTHPYSLQQHLANGRPWDLDRTHGGLLYLHPRDPESPGGGWHRGTADALWRHTDLVRDHDPEVLLVVSADAVYRLDYLAVAQAHADSGAAVTMVTTRVPSEHARRYGVVQVDGERVTDYAYKPEQPASDVVTTEVFAFDPGVLDLLDELGDASGEDGPGDLGDALLPRLVEQGRARAVPLDGYWRDLGTVQAYWSAHQELVREDPPFDPADPDWPLRTRGLESGPARVSAGAVVEDSLVSPECRVDGTVRRSVLGPGAVVEAGAEVVDSVLLERVVVRAGARVVRAVVDRDAEVASGVAVGGEGEVALVGDAEQVTEDVPPGGRWPADQG
jgi:glucose-1-phosphate adenylyltransferase